MNVSIIGMERDLGKNSSLASLVYTPLWHGTRWGIAIIIDKDHYGYGCIFLVRKLSDDKWWFHQWYGKNHNPSCVFAFNKYVPSNVRKKARLFQKARKIFL